MFKVLFSLVTLSLLAMPAVSPAAPPPGGYHPEALRELVRRSREMVKRGGHPVVLFDLDDTTIDTRERTLRILHDFAAQPAVREAFPLEAARIASAKEADVHFLMSDTLQALGGASAELAAAAQAFWLERFFTNEYCAADRAVPGAAAYLSRLAAAGAHLVFLTGRDAPRMLQGTRTSLTRDEFPLDRGELIMKPDAAIDDLAFKESQYEHVAEEGEVIGVFENEPANLNSMAKAFPAADAVFLDTIHSPKPDVPVAKASWVSDFRL